MDDLRPRFGSADDHPAVARSATPIATRRPPRKHSGAASAYRTQPRGPAPLNPEHGTVFDLIAVVNDNRRFLEAEALHSSDPARKAQCQRLSRAQAAVVSRVTRDLARYARHHRSPPPKRQLEIYIDSLISAYSDDSPAAAGAMPKG